MRVLIVVSTAMEVQPMINALGKHTEIGRGVHQFRYKDLTVDLLISGVGMVATAFHMARTLASNKYPMVINLGLCGTFDRSIPLGAVLQTTKDRFSELGAEAGTKFVTMVQLGLMKEADWVLEQDLENPPHFWRMPSLSKLRKVEGITVNTVHGNELSIDRVKRWFLPQVESMEGAAFFYACMADKITNFVQIRAVSNYVEKRNKEEWDIPYAVENLNKFAMLLLEDLFKNRKVWANA